MATTYNDTQIAVIDASGNISVIYPRTKASLVSLSATSYNDVESCLAALGTAAFKNTSNTYNATGTTVATTKAVYDAYTALNSNKINKELLWSGYINTNTTTNLDKSASNYTKLLVIYGVNVTNKHGIIIEKDADFGLNVIELTTTYMCTIYGRAIRIGASSFTTGKGYFWRTNQTSEGNFCTVFEIYGLF